MIVLSNRYMIVIIQQAYCTTYIRIHPNAIIPQANISIHFQ